MVYASLAKTGAVRDATESCLLGFADAIHWGVSRLAAGAIEIAYETLDDCDKLPVVLIAGLGSQLIDWDDGFCEELTSRGLFVIRFDNRDAGLSTHLLNGPVPDIAGGMATGADANQYTLADLAEDIEDLIESAHVVGASMGRMIAQILAIDHPERIRSPTSIMSNTGNGRDGQPTPAALAVLTAPPADTRDGAIESAVTFRRVTGSPAYPAGETEVREQAGRAFDRAFDPAGVARQLMAALTTPDRTSHLRQVRTPTLVLHGTDDPLISVSGGQATADSVPGAELVLFDGMGHDIPRQLWPVIAEHIARHLARAEASQG